MNKYIMLTLFYFCSCFVGIAQENKGIVLDSLSMEPLAGATIAINGKTVAITDIKGMFLLPQEALHDNDTITISYIGYLTLRVCYADFRRNNFTAKLTMDVRQLQDVVVTGSQELQSELHCKKLTNMPVGVYASDAVVTNGKIYIAGGDETVNHEVKVINQKNWNVWFQFNGRLQSYDIAIGTWEISPLSFTKRAYHRIHLHPASGRLYIIGGTQLGGVIGNFQLHKRREYLAETIDVYDRLRDTVLIDKMNPHQAANFASVLYKDNIIVMGGSIRKHESEQKVYSDKMHLYNLSSGYWYDLGVMPKGKETQAVLIDSVIYVVGGFRNAALDKMEAYDIATGKWTDEGKLLHPVGRAAIVAHDHKIYILDGSRIQVYNTKTKQTEGFYMISINVSLASMVYADGKLYIIGGMENNEASNENNEVSNENNEASNGLYSIDMAEFNKTRKYME
ncbi:hypothetical protein FACS1894155_06250 [Bacteroidia bacterium]|nr:hypothetical protein FACS1894155_06250 [Bacteroidia bacterium]